jgi:hypothetical protein
MNPQTNLALSPKSATKSAPKSAMADILSLHAQELRHLGTLRRFKRACDEQPELAFFAHEPDRLGMPGSRRPWMRWTTFMST